MAESRPTRLWGMRLVFVLLSMTLIFFQLLPLETAPRRWAAPDMLVALTLAWSVRRPEYAPALIIAAIMLLADLIFQRPPGLWAAIVLAASALIKPADRTQAAVNFTVEWLRFAAFVIAMTLVYRTILVILLTPPGPLVLSLTQVFGTILVYPLVVVFSWALFGLRRPTPGDMDAIGYRA